METELAPTASTKNIQGSYALEARDVMKSLPLGRERIEILKGISLTIAHGEFVSIVGPSGSGKSTLLGIIAGLDNPTRQVLIDGSDITRMSEAQLAVVRNNKIGMMFQAFNLIPTLTAQENVELPLYVGKLKARPRRVLASCSPWWACPTGLATAPNQLSGGEQQRVAIARALATDPAMWSCRRAHRQPRRPQRRKRARHDPWVAAADGNHVHHRHP